MRIAVTYEQGDVFQHFGHTEEFKVYEVEEGKVISSKIISSDGSGHSALAALLNDKGIDVLICGGIGGGAQAALSERGIELCAGASGNARLRKFVQQSVQLGKIPFHATNPPYILPSVMCFYCSIENGTSQPKMKS